MRTQYTALDMLENNHAEMDMKFTEIKFINITNKAQFHMVCEMGMK